MRAFAVVVATFVCVAQAAVRAYSVEPVKASWSGETRTVPPNNVLAQTVTCCWDSLEAVHLFCGARGDTYRYNLEVKDDTTNARVAYQLGRAPGRDHDWLVFDGIAMDSGATFTKGKRYRFEFRRQGQDSIQYYWAEDPNGSSAQGPYLYGHMIVGGQSQTTRDLAMRCLGRLNAVDSVDFGACDVSWWCSLRHDSIQNRDTLSFDSLEFRNLMEESKARTVRFDLDWNLIQWGGRNSWGWDLQDAQMRGIRADAGCKPLALLFQTVHWASTRVDSHRVANTDGGDTWRWVYDTSLHCAPEGLNRPIDDTLNYLARFIDAVVLRYDVKNESIHDWEVFNEPNDTTCEQPTLNTGWWRRPNRYYQLDAGLRPLCALYMKMAKVIDTVISLHPGHQDDKVAVGSMHRVGGSGGGLVSGRSWLDACYAAATDSNWGIFWDAISMHPYHDSAGAFRPGEFEADAESIRCIMHEHGDYGELWNTEFSMPGLCWWDSVPPSWDTVATPEQDADYCCETFTTAQGLKGLPGGAFDRNYWWLWKQPPSNYGCWALVDSYLNPNKSYYAFKHTAEQLVGKRLNGREMTGDTAVDNHVRMYEFEDPTTLKRTWVSWQNWPQTHAPPPPSEPPAVAVKLPVRTNQGETVVLAYDNDTLSGTKTAGADGWVRCTLTTRPVFVAEPAAEAVSRPDLRADSMWLWPPVPQVGCSLRICVSITNHGSKAMPGSSPGGLSFRWNGTPLQQVPWHDTALDQSNSSIYWCTIPTVPDSMHGWGLFTVTANPEQQFVELGLDDNTACRRAFVTRYATGTLTVMMPSGGINVPLVPLWMSTRSWERDPNGGVAADSARVIEKLVTMTGDTLVDSAASAWFSGSTSDTLMPFIVGEGRVQFGIQARDSWSEGPVTWGPYVTFDTTPPAGIMVVAHGQRFTNQQGCPVSSSVTDSLFPWGLSMRLGNGPLANVCRNSGFVGDDGTWQFSSGGLDTTLGMARLQVVPNAQAWVRQAIPPESIAACQNVPCLLRADVLTRIHNNPVSGELFASYWYTDSTGNDTMWNQFGSASFAAGINPLQTQVWPYVPWQGDSNWTFRGAMVGLRTWTNSSSAGDIWIDNVKLGPYGQTQDYTTWQGYDTLKSWTLTAGSGHKVVAAEYMDGAGNEGPTLLDSVMLDMTPPYASTTVPLGQYVNDTVCIAGYAYDSIEVAGDTWFRSFHQTWCSPDSWVWHPVDPDSLGLEPVYPGGLLGYWNTTGLAAGNYYLQLAADDSAGNQTFYLNWVVLDSASDSEDFCYGPPGGGSGLGDGSVLVGSNTGSVLHLSEDLDTLDAFTVTDSGVPACITAITSLDTGNVLVADGRSKNLYRMTKKGQSKTKLAGNFGMPSGVARDADGNIWLVDRVTSRLAKFRPDGTLVFSKGGLGKGPDELNSPEAIAVKGGLAYVADTKNNRIAVFDSTGDYKRSIKGNFTSPQAIAVTESGPIYLVDGAKGTIEAVDSRGGHIYTISSKDGAPFKCLTLSKDNRHIFTLKPKTNLVLKFRIQSDDSLPGGEQSQGNVNLPKLLTLTQPFPNPARTRLNISYALPRQTRVSVKLYDIAGKLVTTFANNDQKPGYYHINWNRTDARGRSVPAGVYFCTMTAEGQRFSRKVVLTE